MRTLLLALTLIFASSMAPAIAQETPEEPTVEELLADIDAELSLIETAIDALITSHEVVRQRVDSTPELTATEAQSLTTTINELQRALETQNDAISAMGDKIGVEALMPTKGLPALERTLGIQSKLRAERTRLQDTLDLIQSKTKEDSEEDEVTPPDSALTQLQDELAAIEQSVDALIQSHRALRDSVNAATELNKDEARTLLFRANDILRALLAQEEKLLALQRRISAEDLEPFERISTLNASLAVRAKIVSERAQINETKDLIALKTKEDEDDDAPVNANTLVDRLEKVLAALDKEQPEARANATGFARAIQGLISDYKTERRPSDTVSGTLVSGIEDIANAYINTPFAEPRAIDALSLPQDQLSARMLGCLENNESDTPDYFNCIGTPNPAGFEACDAEHGAGPSPAYQVCYESHLAAERKRMAQPYEPAHGFIEVFRGMHILKEAGIDDLGSLGED